MLSEFIRQLRDVPEYFIALKGAGAILLSGLPLYAGLWYFSHRRRLNLSFGMTLNFMSVFLLFAGLAFLLASPLADNLPGKAISAYLFLTCIAGAFSAVSLVDVFFIQHYLTRVKKVYVSPPLRTIIKFGIFCGALLIILRFVLHFNPLALVAIPTIATAGLALALQDTLKTFIAGLSLGKIIRLGEWISFHDKEGVVVNIDWARTVLRTTDGNYIFIPNTQLQTGTFLNYTTGDPSSRLQLKVGVSYDAAPARVKQVLVSCVENVPGVASSPHAVASLMEYADSSIVYGLYYWLEDFSRRLEVQDEVSTRIWYAFRREGIEIPYPIRTLYMKRPEEIGKEKSDHVAKALERWALSEAFYPEELKELGRFAQSRPYARGETIVQEGAEGQSLFVVVSGSVGVYKADRGEKPMAVLHAGDIFGEMSLLTGDVRSASVRSEDMTEVLEIEKAGLQAILAKRPDLTNKLAQLVVERQTVPSDQGSADSSASHASASEHSKLSLRIRKFFGL